MFLQKVHVKNFSRKNRQKFDDISPRLFLFLSNVSLKTVQKAFLKKSCRKVFTKKSTKIQNRFFSLDFLNHVFGRFSVRGVKKKHDIKSRKKSYQPWYFFGLRGTNQPRQGPSVFVLRAPWAPASSSKAGSKKSSGGWNATWLIAVDGGWWARAVPTGHRRLGAAARGQGPAKQIDGPPPCICQILDPPWLFFSTFLGVSR
jgi:hypothetical protein